MLKNLKIGLKISIGFCPLLLLMVLVGYTGYANVLKVTDRAAKSDDMQGIVKNLLEARRHEKNLIIRRQPEYREKTMQATSEMKRLALSTGEGFGHADKKKLMDDVVAATNAYEDAFGHLAVLVLAGGGPTPELAALDKQMVAAARKAQECCEAAVKEQKAEMAAAVTSARRSIAIDLRLRQMVPGEGV